MSSMKGLVLCWSNGLYLSILLLFIHINAIVSPDTFWLNDCNNHGTFDSSTKKCICDNGFGSASDISRIKDPACALRTCPAGRAWVGIPASATTSYGLAECSNMGTCDRGSGKCNCFFSFSGPACEKLDCPKSCSGHGQCLSIKQINKMKTLHPYGQEIKYGGSELTTTWDENRIYGCLCDSSWPVGLGHGEFQIGEYFGTDCRKRRCPSGDDPITRDINETDCHGKSHNGAGTTGGMLGESGNGCHVECSNRGTCNYALGYCNCFDGFTGIACEIIEALASKGST
jgi:hypothetical protein